MGINSVMLSWLDRLADRGAFGAYDSVFELGPQDLFVSRDQVDFVAHKHQPAAAGALVDEVFRYSPSGIINQQAFYRIFGFQRYESCDALDRRAQHRIDLNIPVPDLGPFDCVTNFGTSEHVFNIAEVFSSVHRLLRPGGIALHVLPCCGDVNHGFYSIQPILYFDIARVNGYELVDLLYIDNFIIRGLRHTADFRDDAFRALPVDLTVNRSQIELSRLASEVYAANAASEITREILVADPAAYVVDYCFAALRKAANSNFVMPMQSSCAGWATTADG
jgi:SAM-dependent methyltransferase